MTLENAKSLLENGEFEQARKVLIEITNSEQDNVAAWLLLCGLSVKTEDWVLGLQSFSNLCRCRPNSAIASSGLVQSYFNLAMYDDALHEMERFELACDGNNEEHRSVLEEYQHVRDKISVKKIKEEKKTSRNNKGTSD